MGKVVLNQATINRLGSWGPVDDDIHDRARRVQAMARGRGPIDTGDYVSSIDTESLEPHGWRVIARDHKSAWIEYGTRPHEIRPRNKKALYWPGAAHPVGKVDHPGTAPTHNLAEALELAARGTTHT
ncbi:hypothetical protein [Nocardiopsis sp. NRRL B-16309]|uniref:hypothetical protein n=1 Tax=Nocardiopsis sp. NRRL B-16309 TaxID=1519494 RepID=UPI0006AEAE95|nr:hypothetical protein [Nocardiopsis sp. NRRL B-16309]KOX10140.1 hypothetical protein ADL05_26040 [Nocardiopsis sp. NRRL B-16309]